MLIRIEGGMSHRESAWPSFRTRISGDYWICVRLDCAWLSGIMEIEREIGRFRTILNI